ncbi:MAG: PEGA domain-containing protein [Deltaproteobacteria bacterium]|nr:PEGA domain-containing protein [Deltaproteobacteria bacterium]
MKLRTILIIITLLVSGSSRFVRASEQKGPIIAVFDIEDKGSLIAKDTLDNLVDFLSARMAKAGYRVIPREQVRKRLLEAQKESYKQCYDQSCQIELGREMAAQKTLSIKILKIGATCQITAELYDLRQSTTDLATTAEAKCEDDESMLKAFTAVAEDLNRPLRGSQRRLEDGLIELERLAKSDDGSKAERAKQAWNIAQGIAQDSMIAKEGKVKALRKYLDEFKDAVTEVSGKADALLVEIDLANLVIMSSPPGAKVYINGKESGIAPITKELKAGKYRLRGELDGHNKFEEDVALRPGEKRELSMMLQKIKAGTLVVNASPSGAWVDIDGKTAGQAPVAKELSPGPHEVVVKLAGHLIDRRNVTLVADEQKSLNLQLESIPTRPKMLWGHVAFWSGLGVALVGGAGLANALVEQKNYDKGDLGAKSLMETWTGVMYAGFGTGAALMVTGVVLWILAPDQASWAEQSGGYLGASSDGNSFVLTAGGRW